MLPFFGKLAIHNFNLKNEKCINLWVRDNLAHLAFPVSLKSYCLIDVCSGLALGPHVQGNKQTRNR